jgi:hypothetical protein
MVKLPEDAELPDLVHYLPPALDALRRSVEDLIETFWDDASRNRVCEQATALAHAARIQGLVRIFALSRALASICFITREEALPIRTEVSEKLRELLDLLDAACGDTREEQTG